MEVSSDEIRETDSLSQLKEVLALIKYTKELKADLKDNEDEAVQNQAKLTKLKETQWRLKHRIKSLMSYHEFLNQLTKDPDEWLTPEEVTQKNDEIMAQYTEQKNKYKGMCEEAKKLGEVFEKAEKVAEQEQAVIDAMEEIEKKRKKVQSLKLEFATKTEVFADLCETSEEAEELIQKKRQEVEERKRQIASLEASMVCNEEGASARDIDMVEKMEDFFKTSDTEDADSDVQLKLKLTKLFLGLENSSPD